MSDRLQFQADLKEIHMCKNGKGKVFVVDDKAEKNLQRTLRSISARAGLPTSLSAVQT